MRIRQLPFAVAIITFLSVGWGCGQGIGGEEAREIAYVYAEVLLNQSLGNTNSRSVDSLLQANGYNSVHELQERIEELAREEPEGLKAVFDSTQRRLEEIRDGIE